MTAQEQPMHTDIEQYEKQLRLDYAEAAKKLTPLTPADAQFVRAQILGYDTNIHTALWLARMSNERINGGDQLRVVALHVATVIQNIISASEEPEEALQFIFDNIAAYLQGDEDEKGDSVVHIDTLAPNITGGNA